jgi:3-hydroxymyristoyl/3-hydroxydecanoyl-(acyl carrier protein) dehydratase
MLKKEEIKKIIPYQEPFLFVDGVEEIGENSISGFYQTSLKDYYFKGHFVDFKIMPGVLVVEALAQLSTLFLRKKKEKEHKNYHFLAYNVRSCQFYKPIFPGDKIILKAEILGIYPFGENEIANVKAQAFVNDELKTETRFSIVIIEKKKFEEKYKGQIKK